MQSGVTDLATTCVSSACVSIGEDCIALSACVVRCVEIGVEVGS